MGKKFPPYECIVSRLQVNKNPNRALAHKRKKIEKDKRKNEQTWSTNDDFDSKKGIDANDDGLVLSTVKQKE